MNNETQIKPPALEAANELFKERFHDAKAMFLAGSVVRGEGTPFSDLDRGSSETGICKRKQAAFWIQSG